MALDVSQLGLTLLAAGLFALAPACSDGGHPVCPGPACGAAGAFGSGGGQATGGAPGSGGGQATGGAPGSGGGQATGGAGGVSCVSNGTTCYCGAFAKQYAKNTQPASSCSLASVGGNWCCATSDYPSSGACWCDTATAGCAVSVYGDMCICSHAGPDPGDKPVSTCTAPAGGVCCVEPGVLAPMCTCYYTMSTCPSGTPVSSCDTSQLKCDGRAVDVCK